MDVFTVRERTDRSPCRADETSFDFLDRTGSQFFSPVRDLVHRWVNALPVDDQPGVIGNLSKGDNHSFESAFWELYLHQLVKGSGFDVDIHPEVPGSTKHPDFLVRAPQPFYLEAVSVGTNRERVRSDRRLHDVEAVLDKTRVDGWTLSFNWERIGLQPLKATRLRDELLAWLGTLDHPAEGDDALTQGFVPPSYSFDHEGWSLEFKALPVRSNQAPLVAIRGAGRAVGVDNKTGLRRVLDAKTRRYGDDLPCPLVTAVLSNTEFPTRLYEVQPTLYGQHWLGPARVTDSAELSSDGHWRTKRGWRRSHNPYVVVGCNINLYNLHLKEPWLWRTLDPSVRLDLDIPWAAAVDVEVAEPDPPTADPSLSALGITDAWCAGEPDFEVR
ncbi:hypothetical protein [Nocardioides sp.]|uniref:hypothetical protein n=1 Tax=Nocardioides sp. TaxID=35761 RepID=UPI00321A75B9